METKGISTSKSFHIEFADCPRLSSPFPSMVVPWMDQLYLIVAQVFLIMSDAAISALLPCGSS